LVRELLRRIHYLFNRRRFDDELADEMAFHREMAQKHGGVPLGNALQLREDSREVWGAMWLDRLGQDLRYAFRAMRSSPGFTVAAVLVLSVGIGATVAAFSAFNMVVLRPLPVPDPDSLVRFGRHAPGHASTQIPYPMVAFYRDHARTLSAVLAVKSSSLNLDGDERPATTLFVTSNFFDELGARPVHGRLLNAADGRADAPPAVVLSHGFWASHFGSDPAIVGKSVRLNNRATTLVGVASREFPGLGGDAPAFWAPLEHHGDFVQGSELLTDFSGRLGGGAVMWGRLGPGSSLQHAEEELAALASELRRQHPNDVWEGERLGVKPAGHAELMGAALVFGLIGTLAMLILIVACGNLGSLLLARGAARDREMALRSAIGAGTGRLIRQLFTESLVLAMMGCIGGLSIGNLVLNGLMVWSAAPPWLDSTPDWRVVVFAVAIGLATSVLFGLAPALHVARRKTQRSNATITRSFLIGAQVASSCVLLIVGALLVRAFDRAVSTDPGFEYEHVVVIEPSLSAHAFKPDRARSYIQDLTQRLRNLGGVANVSVTSTPPLGGLKIMAPLLIDGRELVVFIHQVDSRYFATMGIPLLRGRNLIDGDEQSVVVSDSLAARRWPGVDPLGQTMKVGDDTLVVVGLARSARSLAIGDPDTAELYRVARGPDFTELAVVVRTSGPAEGVAPGLSAIAEDLDPNVKPRVTLLKNRFQEQVSDIQQIAIAVSILGAVALAVACLGVVGLVAYAVAARTREIGIRMALGAQAHHVVQSLVSQFQWTVISGLVAGVLGAFTLAQLLRRELYGVSPIDPTAYASAILLFVAAVGLAAVLPARRALRIDPLVALRSE
jgi:predicted permease